MNKHIIIIIAIIAAFGIISAILFQNINDLSDEIKSLKGNLTEKEKIISSLEEENLDLAEEIKQQEITPTIEAIKIPGYDARDVDQLKAHTGSHMDIGTGSNPETTGKNIDERVAIYVRNDGVNQVILDEIRLAGTIYTYSTTVGILGAFGGSTPMPGEYVVLIDEQNLLQEQVAVLNPGQTATILIDLAYDFPIGKDQQFKLETANESVFVGTIVMGWNSGQS